MHNLFCWRFKIKFYWYWLIQNLILINFKYWTLQELCFRAHFITLQNIYKYLREHFQTFKREFLNCSEKSITELEKWLNEYCKTLRKPTYDADVKIPKSLEKHRKVRKKRKSHGGHWLFCLNKLVFIAAKLLCASAYTRHLSPSTYSPLHTIAIFTSATKR
jgi:hypothetical protein